jgi:hypothetical protein
MVCARIRATASVDPPGGNCKTSRIGLLGQAWANTWGTQPVKQTPNTLASRIFFMDIPAKMEPK